MSERIQLTQHQKERLKSFRVQIESHRAQINALEQGVFGMLSTIVEMQGIPEGLTYSLSDDSSELVLQQPVDGKPEKE